MSYDKLLNDLETLQKSYAADEDDQRIQAAAAKAKGDKDDDEELDDDGKPIVKKKPAAKEDDEDKECNPFAKSFMGVTKDGREFEAIDATEMLKSFHDEIESGKADQAKSLTFLVGIVKSQGALIKALQENYIELANQGRGRKSVTEPSFAMAKSLQDGQPLNAQGFMLKANAAFDSGRITGKELTTCDVAIRMGQSIDQTIVSKVLA